VVANSTVEGKITGYTYIFIYSGVKILYAYFYADRPEIIVSAGVCTMRIHFFTFYIIKIGSAQHMRRRPLSEVLIVGVFIL
jgi:hypothetical protein